uniref:Uncharacterized protein n=1 Tax=Arundo donax TaxID=35708 RepID=A0A0A8ZU76_ARUDO
MQWNSSDMGKIIVIALPSSCFDTSFPFSLKFHGYYSLTCLLL